MNRGQQDFFDCEQRERKQVNDSEIVVERKIKHKWRLINFQVIELETGQEVHEEIQEEYEKQVDALQRETIE